MRRCAAIAAVVLCAASLPARPQGGSAAASPEAEVELTADRIVYDWEDRKLELKRMYLRQAQRGRGLGKRLLATALDWARANGAASVKLDTTESMQAARALYEAYGFRRVPGEVPRQGQRRLLYELRL